MGGPREGVAAARRAGWACAVSHCGPLFATPWTVARPAPPPMGFPGTSTGVLPLPGDLPDPESDSTSPALTGGFFITEPPGKP